MGSQDRTNGMLVAGIAVLLFFAAPIAGIIIGAGVVIMLWKLLSTEYEKHNQSKEFPDHRIIDSTKSLPEPPKRLK